MSPSIFCASVVAARREGSVGLAWLELPIDDQIMKRHSLPIGFQSTAVPTTAM
jgi:hypothetical protein